MDFPGGSAAKESTCSAEDLGWEDPLEKGTVTHSSILAWRIPWTEEPGRLQSTGSMHPWGHKESGTTEPPSLSLFSCYQATLVSCCTPYLVWPFSSLTPHRSPMSFSNADLFFMPFIDFRIAQRVGRKLLAGPQDPVMARCLRILILPLPIWAADTLIFLSYKLSLLCPTTGPWHRDSMCLECSPLLFA